MIRPIAKFSMLAVVVAAAASVTGCGGKTQDTQSQDEEIVADGRTDRSMSRTAADTIAIRTLTLNYLNNLYEKKYDDALGMLYSWTDSISTLGPLSDTQRQRLLSIMRTFPVTGYSIDEINIYSEDDTEVRYTIELFERQPGETLPNTMQFQLNPHRFNGQWYLCVTENFRDPNKIRREDVVAEQ